MSLRIHKLPLELTLLLMFLIPFISYSQYHHGLVLGPNYTTTNFNIGESSASGGRIGFKLGYFAEQEFSDRFYSRFGVNFNRIAFSAINRRGINTSKEKWGLDMFEIPINLGYYLNWNNQTGLQFFIDAGINIGYNNRAIIRNTTETIRLDISSNGDIKRIVTGANGSFGALINKRLKLRLNYYTTLSNITNDTENVWKNNTISISLNYFLKESEIY